MFCAEMAELPLVCGGNVNDNGDNADVLNFLFGVRVLITLHLLCVGTQDHRPFR